MDKHTQLEINGYQAYRTCSFEGYTEFGGKIVEAIQEECRGIFLAMLEKNDYPMLADFISHPAHLVCRSIGYFHMDNITRDAVKELCIQYSDIL